MVRRLFDSVHDMMVHPNGSQWTVLGYIMAEDERLECNDSFDSSGCRCAKDFCLRLCNACSEKTSFFSESLTVKRACPPNGGVGPHVKDVWVWMESAVGRKSHRL